MKIRTFKLLILVVVIAFVGIMSVVFIPRIVSAEAGSGGGGGSSGCSQFNYSTCFGAVWRYYRTSSNSVNIPNVGGGSTNVSGCGSTGGFFAYVLVNKNSPGYTTDTSLVRSWKIGPNDGDPNDRSRFFGGWTNYRLLSNPSDPIPINPVGADYSWYSVEKAFAQTKALGQNAGYNWNGNSTLGWFCYRGTSYNLIPSVTSDRTGGEAGEPINVTPRVNNTGSSASYSTYWTISSMAYASGINPPSAGANGTNGGSAAVDTAKPCQYYSGTGASACQFLAASSGTGIYNIGSPSIFTFSTGATWGTTRLILGNYAVGTKACYALSVYSRNEQTGTSQTWAHSAPTCIIISRKPKVQVHGGDVIVGRSFVDGATGSSSGVNTSQTLKYR